MTEILFARQDDLEDRYNETIAAKDAAEAAQEAAETAQTGAETAETNAATHETNAETAATNASNSETAAATSATNAATSETNAGTSETNAAVSETNAAASAVEAVNAVSAVAFEFTWSTSTSGDPGTGAIAVNNATPGSSTELNISETDANGNNLATEIARWGANANANGRARVKISKNPNNYLLLTLTTAVTDNGTYDTFTHTSATMVGSFGNGDAVWVEAAVSGIDGAGGDFSSNTSTSVVDELILFSDTGGKTGKRATTTGVLKATDGVLAAAVADTDYLAPAAIGVTVQGYDADTLKADVTTTLSVGYNNTAYSNGTQSSGTLTLDPALGNIQTYTNGGAHTLAPPATACSIIVDMTNNGSAGVVTTSGWTKVDGDTLTTTDTHVFRFYCSKIGSYSHLSVKRMV